MKALVYLCATALVGVVSVSAQEPSLESAPPVVISTVPPAGSTTVEPTLTEIRVTFSKPMQDGSWSWTAWSEESLPEMTGQIHYLADGRTCVAPVKLQPGKFYATWLNSEQFQNFRGKNGEPAVPYLLSFQTAPTNAPAPTAARSTVTPLVEVETAAKLNSQQQQIVDWTERQFRSFFDRRTFDGWTEKERVELETRSLDSLKGPQTRDYYQAIGTLAALHSQKAVQPLLAIASDRADKDCRDRWMAIRALGIIGDRSVAPELIHLVYHGNVNTRWWSQISLVRLTGQNFGNDWKAWGQWWNSQGAAPAFKPDFVVWYNEEPWSNPEKVQNALADADQKFFAELSK